METSIEVTHEEFDQEVLKADLPVLVGFWAEWCAPCKIIGPMMEELSEEYDGKIKFVKLDTEENFDVPARYGIRGLPLPREQQRRKRTQPHQLVPITSRTERSKETIVG